MLELILMPEVYIPLVGVVLAIAGIVVKKTENKYDDKIYNIVKESLKKRFGNKIN